MAQRRNHQQFRTLAFAHQDVGVRHFRFHTNRNGCNVQRCIQAFDVPYEMAPGISVQPVRQRGIFLWRAIKERAAGSPGCRTMAQREGGTA